MNRAAVTDSDPVALRIPGRDLRLHLHGARDQVISRRIREDGIWEPYETRLVLSLLRPGDVFVDAGANIGYFSVLAAAAVGPAGAVYAFEPDPDNCRLLRDNVLLNGVQQVVHVVEAALADRDGDAPLYLSEDNLGDHQLFTDGAPRPAVRVALVDGGSYLAGRIGRLDLLKVDTQGAEFLVLSGLMPLLRQLPAPPRILIELTPYSLRAAGASGRGLVELLASLGQPLHIVDHIEHRLAPSTAAELALWCDNVAATPGDQGFMNILVGAPD